MNKRRKWTTTELQRLQEQIAAGKPVFVIAKALKRTEASVHGQVAILKKHALIAGGRPGATA